MINDPSIFRRDSPCSGSFQTGHSPLRPFLDSRTVEQTAEIAAYHDPAPADTVIPGLADAFEEVQRTLRTEIGKTAEPLSHIGAAVISIGVIIS